MAFSIALSVVKDEFLAEEVVQNAFVKAYRNLDKFNRDAKFSTWFYRIVTNEALLTLKRKKREIIDFGIEYKEDIIDENEIYSMQYEDMSNLVNEALKQLSPKESLALRLFYLEEESVKSVGEITGWSASNIKVILHRARKNMIGVLNHLRNKKDE